MACYAFEGFIPVVHESSFVHPLAAVTGNVIVGRDVYIGPGAALRGDWGGIVVEDGCNVQENCVVHMFPGTTVVLEAGAHIGHGAIVHGARVGRNTLIGMNATLMDNASIGAECIVGALTFVPAEMQVPDRSVVVGNPARIVKQVTDTMLQWKTDGTRLYQQLPSRLRASFEECEPLRTVPEARRSQQAVYETWNRTRAERGPERD
jgi:carbonic anhydrase/acetyltransferase-like protein (isoleucine patch superfamily)